MDRTRPRPALVTISTASFTLASVGCAGAATLRRRAKIPPHLMRVISHRASRRRIAVRAPPRSRMMPHQVPCMDQASLVLAPARARTWDDLPRVHCRDGSSGVDGRGRAPPSRGARPAVAGGGSIGLESGGRLFREHPSDSAEDGRARNRASGGVRSSSFAGVVREIRCDVAACVRDADGL